MVEQALLDVRALPWRPRTRVMKPGTVRDVASPDLSGEDVAGVVLGLAIWLLIVLAAPLVVLVLAVGLLSVELPIVVALGVILVVVRFAGLLPWTVVVVHQVSGEERRESYRALWRAVRRIREVNPDRRVRVRWAWV